jgi:hypothetical protein
MHTPNDFNLKITILSEPAILLQIFSKTLKRKTSKNVRLTTISRWKNFSYQLQKITVTLQFVI